MTCGNAKAGCGEGHGGRGVVVVTASWIEIGTTSVIHSSWSVSRIHGEGSDPSNVGIEGTCVIHHPVSMVSTGIFVGGTTGRG